jgi:phosphatidylserine/phosphatidylglycerophosphate/cardiolipin synthase-like enzyme
MNTTICKVFAVAVLLIGCQSHYSEKANVTEKDETNSCPMPTNVQWDVHFSPNGGATETIVRFIDGASKSIYVQAYSFTSVPIAMALVAAHKRGVHVEILLDKSDITGRGTVLPIFREHGVPTFIDARHAIAHNKILIIDQVTVFTGSFNFTNAAEHANAENSIRLTDPRIAVAYQGNWNMHRGHSQ